MLLVEDNRVNQMLAQRLLERWGHHVVVAETGRKAVAAHARQKFDVILMDVQMPEMNGFEATAAIRAAESGGRRIPIIAMTAHAMKGDRERCLAGRHGRLRLQAHLGLGVLRRARTRGCPAAVPPGADAHRRARGRPAGHALNGSPRPNGKSAISVRCPAVSVSTRR